MNALRSRSSAAALPAACRGSATVGAPATPTNPKNRRLRCSILVERMASATATTACSSIPRRICASNCSTGVERLDGILMTHAHADHTHGIDDVRPLVINMRRRIDVYMDERDLARTVREQVRLHFRNAAGQLISAAAE